MTVEVCPICDIAGCKHIREKTHPMTHDTPPKRITLEEAQAAVDPRLVAEILRDFGTNFDGVYPVGVLARGVGPEQSMIGLAIKRGHLVTRSHADAMVAAALREAAKIAVRHWEGEEEDSLVMCEAILTLIPQPDAAAPDIARALLDARADAQAAVADIVRSVWGRCEALEDEAADKLAQLEKLTDHEKGFWRGQKTVAKSIRRSTEMPTAEAIAIRAAKGETP